MNNLRFIVVTLSLVCIGVLAATRVGDPDTMQYLASGRYTLQQGFETGCVFSYATDRCQIVYPQWLFHVAAYGAYRVGGWNALVVLQVALAVGVFAIGVVALRRRSCDPLVTAPFILLAGMVARERFTFRADLFALVPAVLLYWVLERYWDEATTRAMRRALLAALAAIQMIWANTHGSFPVGLLILAAFVTESLLTRKPGVREVIEAVAATVLASFLNPFGLKSFLQPFRFMLGGEEQAPQLEFFSPFAPADLEHLTVTAYKILLGVLVVLVVLSFRKLKPRHLLVLAAVTYLSVKSMRHIALFAVFCAAVLPPCADDVRARIARWLARKGAQRRFAVVAHVASAVMIATTAGIVYTAVTNQIYRYDAIARRTGFGVSDLVFPSAAAEFVERNNLPGEMFNDYSIGTYLNWRLFPARKTFIDGHSYTPESLGYYRQVMAGAVPYQGVADRFGIGFFFLSHKSSESRDLIAKLNHDERWALVYFDEIAMIFVERRPANEALIAKLRIDPAAFDRAGPSPLVNIREPEDFYLGHTDRGVALSVLGITAAATAELDEAAKERPDSFVTQTALGLLLAQRGDAVRALEACERAVRSRPGYAPARLLLGILELGRRRTREGIAQLEAALRINPKLALAHYNLGAAYENGGDKRRALEHYRKELEVNPSYQPALSRVRKLS